MDLWGIPGETAQIHFGMKRASKAVKFDLDAMLTLKQCSAWIQLSAPTLRRMVKDGELPVFAVNQRTWRFHPRTILLTFKQLTKDV